MKRIYVAGPYSADNVIDVLGNIRKGVSMSAYLMGKGYAVFCPFLDFQLALSVYGDVLTKAMYQANSMAFVEGCDAMLVLEGWKTSCGTKKEIKRAKELGIPVYYDRAKLEKELEHD